MTSLLRFFLCITFIGSLAACSGISDTRPDVLRSSERLLERGVNAYHNSDYVGATDFFSRALTHYRSIDHRQGMLFSHINLAESALAMGQHSGAGKHLLEATSLAHELDDIEQQHRTALLQAQLAWRQSQADHARQILHALLAPPEQGSKHSDTLQLAALALRCEIAFSDADADGAEQWLQGFEQAIKRSSEATPQHQARLLRFQAQQLQRQGEHEQADTLREAALAIYRETAQRPAVAATLTEQGQSLLIRQRHAEAEDRLQRALYIRIWMLDRHNSRKLLEQLAQVQALQGKDEAASQSRDYAQRIQHNSADWQALRQQVKPR